MFFSVQNQKTVQNHGFYHCNCKVAFLVPSCFWMNFGLLFLPKCFKNQPKSLKISLKSHFIFMLNFWSLFVHILAPNWLHFGPRVPQDPPRDPPRSPQGPPGTPLGPPGLPQGPQGTPQGPLRTPRDPPGLHFGWFWLHFGIILDPFWSYLVIILGSFLVHHRHHRLWKKWGFLPLFSVLWSSSLSRASRSHVK